MNRTHMSASLKLSFSMECQIHPGRIIQSFSINKKCSQRLFCIRCSPEKGEEVVLIEDILRSDDDSIIENWPPLEKKIQTLSNGQLNMVDIAFRNFQHDFNAATEQLKKNVIIYTTPEQLPHSALQTYNEIASKDDLKRIFQLKDLRQIEKSLDSLITDKQDNKQLNSCLIESVTPTVELKELDLKTLSEGFEEVVNSIQKVPYSKQQKDEKVSSKSSITPNPDKSTISKISSDDATSELIKEELKEDHFRKFFLKMVIEDIFGGKGKQRQEPLITRTEYDETPKGTFLSIDNQGRSFIQQINNNGMISAFLSQQISNEKKYILRFEYKLGRHDFYNFWLGLVPRKIITSRWQNDSSLVRFSMNEDVGVTKIIKGGNHWDEKIRKPLEQYEIRFSIKDKLFSASDYPSFANISEIDEKKKELFKDDIEYVIGVQMCQEGDCFTLIELKEVEDFPDYE